MLEDLALPFAIMDTNGRMVWSNRLFASLMGKDQLYNKNIATLLPDITQEKLPVPGQKDITEVTTGLGNEIYRVSMQCITMKDVVEHTDILEKLQNDLSLIAVSL